MINKNSNFIQGNEKPKGKALTTSLESNIYLFKCIFSGDETLVVRKFQNKFYPAAACCIIFFEHMIDSKILNENIMQPVLNSPIPQDLSPEMLLSELQYKVMISDNINKLDNINTMIDYVLSGDTIFMLEGCDKALIIESKGWQSRSITEPESSRVVRGPREGFTEVMGTNISLLRRIIRNPSLKFKFTELGERTHTKICVCFLEDLASKSILKELGRRLSEIKIDGVLDSGYIQEMIRDAPFSPFETVGYTEKPDVIASKLLEGRIAIMVEGSPFVLTVPHVMVEDIQANEDYYNNYFFASFNRLLRAVSTILSICTPALWVVVVAFNQEMLPTPLLISITAGRQDVPFPTVVSLIVMLTIFDLLREASVRMPSPIGQAINIVGTLILGQALAEAKLVSPHIIIITAITGILSLINNTMLGAIIIFRLVLLVFASFLGIYGFLFGLIIILIHLMSIRSFGVPYMMNLASLKSEDIKDVWIRAPWWEMTLRPKIIGVRNMVRLSKRKNKGK